LNLSNEDKARKMEKIVIDLVEESCLAYEKNDSKLVRKYFLSFLYCFLILF
jgi:hypothetical protein